MELCLTEHGDPGGNQVGRGGKEARTSQKKQREGVNQEDKVCLCLNYGGS